MKTVYGIHWANNQQYEDYRDGIEDILYESKDDADKAVAKAIKQDNMLNEAIEDGFLDPYSFSITEFTLLAPGEALPITKP